MSTPAYRVRSLNYIDKYVLHVWTSNSEASSMHQKKSQVNPRASTDFYKKVYRQTPAARATRHLSELALLGFHEWTVTVLIYSSFLLCLYLEPHKVGN